MEHQIRRIVTGHDAQGKAIVLSDGAVPTVHSNPIRPGQQSFEVWKTRAMPIPIAPEEAEPTTGPRSLQPPQNGTLLRISIVPPESAETRNLTPEQAQELFRKSGAGEASTFGKGGRHPMMHRTETVDYAVVLEGEITLILDERRGRAEDGRCRHPARHESCLEQPLREEREDVVRADGRRLRARAREQVSVNLTNIEPARVAVTG